MGFCSKSTLLTLLQLVEAMWRMFAFDLNQIHPAVMLLQVHMENKQPMAFPDNRSLQSVINSPSASRTVLKEFFARNASNEMLRGLIVYTLNSEYLS